jgi:AhpD family alkylhydroperoxidase
MYDMKNLEKFKMLETHAPETMKAVALTTQCPYCIELHVERARKLNASDAEIAEAALAAAALRAGSSVTHGTHAMK